MKTQFSRLFLSAAAFIILFCFFSTNVLTQPQYYNYENGGTGNNNFPFNVSNGKEVQWLIGPNTLNQPTPLPPGNKITKMYFYTTSATAPTYTQLMIRAGQSSITALPTGSWYSDPMDTLYFRASVSISSPALGWMIITLDKPLIYNPALSLIVEVSQCGVAGTGPAVRQNSIGTNTRSYSSTTGCPNIYSGQDGSIINFGVDVVPAGPVIPNYYSSNWCPANTYPSLPAATFYQESAWMGDTLYLHAPDASGLATTTIRRYTLGGAWTLGVPLPVVKAGGTLTAANGKLYYIGGGSSVSVGSTDIYEYSGGVWTLKAPMPLALSGHSAVNWGDSVLFVLGGPWASGGTAVYFYRIGSNTWGTSTSFATARRSQCSGLSGNKIYVAGGFPFTKSFQIGTIGSNASTISWVAGPDIPTPAAFTGLSRIGGFAIGNAFYTVGGERGGPGGYYDTVHVWSIPGNAWFKVISGKPGGGMSNIFAGVSGRVVNDTAKIFLPGGYTGAGSSNFDVIGCGPNIFTGLTPINTQLPDKFILSQNYPNPFNPVTIIKFSIPVGGNVKLVVSDILGREVAVLLNEVKPAGNYLVDYDASKLSSGIYFYTLKSGDFTETKKMLLVK